MSEEKSDHSNLWVLLGGLIVLFYVFIFDYKKQDFNWGHSIVALLGIGMLLTNIGNI